MKVCFELYDVHAPALRSALEELGNSIGHKLESPRRFEQQDALTRAAVAVNSLRAAITAKTPPDPDYR